MQKGNLWRPPDWEPSGYFHPDCDIECLSIFEAGADAMLEALKKERGVRITKATRMVTQPIFEEADGWLVFIPDENQ